MYIGEELNSEAIAYNGHSVRLAMPHPAIALLIHNHNWTIAIGYYHQYVNF
ncbi:hypothetical protein SAMD00079811_01830 [Scytonema sp. HK-05]|uniref:hypothetical protein n=1 Tax=Scytonema sp. HK-05 TaxID=1137095 RepID=UPI000AC75386|nr:hypothetical protein [Scytonema sp. HK-05]BAY42605.1 hypothetical protein SAMD00079811_01830 [Scytonema sp. HK-05]